MYDLTISTDTRRTYRSSITGTEIFTNVIYTDGSGNKWWAFEDLLQIPFIRKKAAEQISQYYGLGFTIQDKRKFVDSMKVILKANDTEKYEKAFSQLLHFAELTENTMDLVKQNISLCAIYILSDKERVDSFSSKETSDKLELWAIDLEAQAFFLTWLQDGMTDFTKHYSAITQIASNLPR